MITGAHTIIYSENPEADIAFFRDVLQFNNVDVGNGWLIFALPPGEMAFHPADENGKHELYLMCDNVQAFVKEMTGKGVVCSEVRDMRWGLLTSLALPGGGQVGVYEPRHARPEPMK